MEIYIQLQTNNTHIFAFTHNPYMYTDMCIYIYKNVYILNVCVCVHIYYINKAFAHVCVFIPWSVL